MPDGSGRVPDFNPHHRTGGDLQVFCMVPGLLAISIHTTARVVTCLSSFSNSLSSTISIHTTARVVTMPKNVGCPALLVISIHTTARVVTEGVRNKLELALISIHTTARVVTI